MMRGIRRLITFQRVGSHNLANRLTWLGFAALRHRPRVSDIHTRVLSMHTDGFGQPLRRNRSRTEFVRRTEERCVMEPFTGYLIARQGSIIADSVRSDRIGLPARYPSPRPFLPAHRVPANRPAIVVGSTVSLRHPWENNYYHFFVDVLGKLALLEQVGVDSQTPLIVGQYASSLPFSDIISRGSLANRQWIHADNRLLQLDNCYYCRTLQDVRTRTQFVLDLLELPRLSDDLAGSDHRIFVGRATATSRVLVNSEEVLALLKSYDFELIDPAALSFREQVDVFSRARHVVAIHGAGLTNVVFRRGLPMGVLELQSSRWSSVVYKELCLGWGYSYRRLVCEDDGSPNPQRANLRVDLSRLKIDIEALLADAPHK